MWSESRDVKESCPVQSSVRGRQRQRDSAMNLGEIISDKIYFFLSSQELTEASWFSLKIFISYFLLVSV